LSTGTTKPSDVADNATASRNGLFTNPAAEKPNPAALPSTSVTT